MGPEGEAQRPSGRAALAERAEALQPRGRERKDDLGGWVHRKKAWGAAGGALGIASAGPQFIQVGPPAAAAASCSLGLPARLFKARGGRREGGNSVGRGRELGDRNARATSAGLMQCERHGSKRLAAHGSFVFDEALANLADVSLALFSRSLLLISLVALAGLPTQGNNVSLVLFFRSCCFDSRSSAVEPEGASSLNRMRYFVSSDHDDAMASMLAWRVARRKNGGRLSIGIY